MAGCPCRWTSIAILVLSGCLLACSTASPVNALSVQRSPDQQTLVITSANQVVPHQFALKHLPTESTIAPGLYFRPKQFGLVQVSPDGRFAAFSTVDHHALVGLLNLATMAVQEIDVVTEGEILSFHWTADGHTLAYDYLPASGYHRVRGYDVQSGEGLVVPHTEYGSATHLTFEQWGSQPREMILRLREQPPDAPQSTTVRLIPNPRLVPTPRPQQ